MAPASPVHVPLLRAGRSYRSLEIARLADLRDGSPVAEVSQASPGLIARDLGRIGGARRALEERSVAELLEICSRAAGLFETAELPVGDPDADGAELQGPEGYLESLAATAGMPIALGRANMGKIVRALENQGAILGGLTRGLDLSALDRGWTLEGERRVSFLRQADALGAVLPNNSPGVHTLWLPAIPLKTPLVLRPGSAEPWTPLRIARALLAAGCPPEALSVYPGGHEGADRILLSCQRSMVFGDASTVERWSRDTRVQAHGPGWSKVFLDHGAAGSWPEHLDLIADSVLANGGRSCINASGVWTAAAGRELAEALARRLAEVTARPLDDPRAQLAAFPDPAIAHRISAGIDAALAAGGAEDLTAAHRDGGRVAEAGGATFLLPTVIWCSDPDHPL
ncbi:MAG: aldehyde dehydrogenase family protein, partial [Acidobacteria bacterium]|nr:aldehyde dehydrogenase family protein [Acidobacteriota bacterium]